MSRIRTLADIFESVCSSLLEEYPSDERGRMLHAPAIKTSGTCYAFLMKDGLVVKLPEQRVAELVAGDAGRAIGTGRGRPMREWVSVAPRDVRGCRAYMLEARRFVSASGGKERHERRQR